MPALLEPPCPSMPQPFTGTREFPDSEFLNIPDVPIFAEHETTTKSGRHLRFRKRELELLAANCNSRIEATGDYAGICIGHTPEDPDDYEPKPLIGVGGPFRVRRLPGKSGLWAIFADLHVRREHAADVKRFPRRSAELWIEDDYENMILDPIALLGAESPRLGLGLTYSARSHRGEPERYARPTRPARPRAAAAPAPRRSLPELAGDYIRIVEKYSKLQDDCFAAERCRATPADGSLRDSLHSLARKLGATHRALETELEPLRRQAMTAAKARAAKGERNAYETELAALGIPPLIAPRAFV